MRTGSTFVVVDSQPDQHDIIVNTNAISAVRKKLEPDGSTTTVIGLANGRSVSSKTAFQNPASVLQAGSRLD